MAGASAQWANDLLHYEFRAVAYAPPATHYVALFSTDPGKTYSAATELPATGGYARVAVTRAATSWSVATASGGRQVVTNLADINLGTASAGWNGGVAIPYVGIMDSATVGAGTLKGSGAIGTPKVVAAGDAVVYEIGSLSVGLG